MQFKTTHLQKILGCSAATEAKWLDAINAACAQYNINTKLRLAAFIAQVGHESARLTAVTENLNYSAAGLMKTWPSRFDSAKANACARNPQKIANVVYSNRMGNGNEASGDGWTYRGRGLIQVTGKSMYNAFSQSAGVNAVANPDLLTQVQYAALSAAWFWDSKSLNAYADRSDLLSTTKRINGGTNGQDDREMLYKKALAVLSDEPTPTDEQAAKKADPAPDTTAPVSDQKTPAAQNGSIVEPRASGAGGVYPWNLVYESRSGHFTEVDDTPGAERLNMTHRTGSYWEMNPLGTYTLKSVLDFYKLTKGDSYDYTGGNYSQQVQGQAYRQSSGDMVFTSGGTVFFNASKVQMNTGMLAVSGEVNAGMVNSPMFSGFGGGLAYGDLLAKQALVAYDLIDGDAPMMSGSLGFTGGSTGSTGSADSQLTNTLSKKAPNGTPWVTNGVPPSASSSSSGSSGGSSSSGSGGTTVSSSSTLSSTNSNDYDVPQEAGTTFKVSDLANVGAAAAGAAGAVMSLLKNNDADPAVANAMASSVGALDQQQSSKDSNTPFFLKHVSFDKPTLISMSTSADAPDPSLYMNNIHTIVDATTGFGRLYMSNGQSWQLVGDGKEAKAYTDQVASDLNAQLSQKIVDEAVARAQAISDEAAARQAALTAGLLDEATQRQAAVTAEATARQTADSSLSDRILTLTASVNDNAAAIQEEQTARADAITAEANARLVLASQVSDNTAAIISEQTTRSNADSALSTRIDQVSATTDSNTAAITSEANARTTADNALSTRIDAVVATASSNTAAITTEASARASADSALSDRIDAVVATANGNTAAIVTESSARASGDAANATQISVVQSQLNSAGSAINRLNNPTFLSLTSGLPTGWAIYNNGPESASLSMVAGPDAYQAVRVSWTAANTSTKGICQTGGLNPNMRANFWYIIAFKVRAVTNTVGAKVSAQFSNTPSFSDYVEIQSPTLTTDWQWYIAKCRRTAGDSGELFISILGSMGSASYDISEPVVQEGQTFLGFNEGTIVASVMQESSTRATQVGQIQAQWAIKTNVNGAVAGIALVSDLINGNPSSSFTVQADQFKLVSPSNSSLITNPFTVDSSGNAVFAGVITVKSAPSGQRTEITNSAINVYDSSGTLRVRLGVW